MKRLLTTALALALACLMATATAEATPRGPLGHEGRWITDADGRVVILHGWNMVYKVGSYEPKDSGFGPDDMKFLRRHGFNTIRLGIIQNGVEPELPGADGKARYRNDYLRSIARTQYRLGKKGIFSLLDVHQDLYNERFEGEGFPDWAVVGDAATLPAEPAQGFPANYLGMPALNRAFDHFWLNDSDAAGRPLQDSFAAMWRHIAKRFGNRPRIVGFNILNEPWPGSQYPSCVSTEGCPAFDAEFLQPFTERVIEEIRKVNTSRLVWYAPLLVFDFGADTGLGDTGDPDAGFAFNLYCIGEVLGEAPPGACDLGYDLTFANAEEQSQLTGDALLMTEFAATNDMDKIERVAGLADDNMVGWQQWHYCDCEDPTTTGTGVQSLVSNPHKPPRGDNLNRDKLRASSRPYPQVVAGTPLEYGFDPDSGVFDLTYSTKTPTGKTLGRRKLTEIFIPPIHYHGDYDVTIEGGRVVSKPGTRNLRVRRAAGAREVSLVVRPASAVKQE